LLGENRKTKINPGKLQNPLDPVSRLFPQEMIRQFMIDYTKKQDKKVLEDSRYTVQIKIETLKTALSNPE